ncbi:MAG TPA: acyltransferase [Terracidiphilus sp.]|jgi:peptidoglycan/LPS O-acetylase OafA/YrhL|nr:acyltransferase [Terracidiphilus sp.]
MAIERTIKRPPQPARNGTRIHSPRIDGIDILRGLAIFFVLMNHVNMRLLGAHVPYTHGLPPQLVSSLVWNGQFGVQIFFAVSGFLITSTALRRYGSIGGVSARQFYELRFARIAPLLLALLAVLSVLHLAQVRGFIVSSRTGGLPAALFAALTFHVNLLEARRGYLPPAWDILWSLSVEETFYLFFPLACRLFRRGRYLLVPLGLFVLLGPFARSHVFNANPVWREYSYLGGMDAIAMGCITALCLSRRALSRIAARAACVCGSALLVFCLCFSIFAGRLGLERTGLTMSILAAGTCMVMAAASQTQWRAPAALKPLLKLGQRSYEIYLTHLFIALGLFDWFLAAGKPIYAVPALFLAVVLLSGILGELVARGYSERMNRWLRMRWKAEPDNLQVVANRSGE